MLFSNRDLRRLLVPLVIEQVLTSMMGIVDTMMVSNLGSAPVSGVSLVDSINKLVLFLFTALASGGSIVCAQYLGRRDKINSDRAARQVLLSAFVLGLLVTAVCLLCYRGLLRLIFGSVEAAVMEAAQSYFFYTAFSYPFVALFNAAAALYRSAGNSRLPMLVSVSCNFLNIAGNALLMFVLRLGVSGAAIATTVSTAVSAVAMLICLRRPAQAVEVGRLTAIRPDFRIIWLVLSIGIPSGVENAMFQFGKLMVQSTVSTLGTAAIAANAIIVPLEYLSSMPSTAIGTGLMTVAGQCIGAGKLDQARYYIKKLTLWGALVLLAANWVVYAATYPVVHLAALEPDALEMTLRVMLLISLVKPLLWPLSFLPVNGMRAAGDVKFSMIFSMFSMWIFRVGLTTLLCRFFNFGLTGIWCGYFADWFVRSLCFALRYRSGKWSEHHVIETAAEQ
ncbi:MAG: MATE family efflux transporter [Oscillospiraceae bacterium]|nr:MATE family efflux transporter [Oscillospiraceae bacterium]